jgi:streptomycin 6-kinase
VAEIQAGITERFAGNVGKAFGAKGESWLHALPALLTELAGDWGLTLGPPFDLSFNYVAPVTLADGTTAVLKVGVPDEELLREGYALRLYDGVGACRLLRADESRCAILLEQLLPGETLAPLAATDDDAATRIAAGVMRALWRPVTPESPFLPVAEWFARAFAHHRAEYGGAGPFPAPLFERAQALVRELLDSAPETVLLHGDLHHYNILSNSRHPDRAPWLAIDPKGVTGDPGYDVGQFLLNPDWHGAETRPSVVRRRLDVFAEALDYDRTRLAVWAVAEPVLSACWSAEDGGNGWQGAIAAAEAALGP